MSTQKDTSGNLKDWLSMVVSVLGFLTALVAFIGNFLQWIRDPQAFRYLSIAGFALFVMGILWFYLTAKKEEKKKKWRYASLIALYSITAAYFLWVGTWMSRRIYPVPPQPLNVHTWFDFESKSSIDAWNLKICDDDPCEGGDSTWNPIPANLSWGASGFTGEHSLGIQMELAAQREQVYSIQHCLSAESLADAVTANIYVPHVPANNRITVKMFIHPSNYDGLWPVSSFDIWKPGWHRISLDLRYLLDDSGIPFSDRAVACIHIDFILPESPLQQIESVTVLIDDIELYSSLSNQ